ncbi:hypothetical protein OROMI_021081 [Orobanche minor]
MFIKASAAEAKAIQEVLSIYEEASGQLINMGKSSISFSLNTSTSVMGLVKQTLGLSDDCGIQMYLGLPAFTLRQKRLQVGYVGDNVQKKLLGWNQREFLAVGRRCPLRRLFRLSRRMLCNVFGFPTLYVPILIGCVRGFGGGVKKKGGECIGLEGIVCVRLR